MTDPRISILVFSLVLSSVFGEILPNFGDVETKFVDYIEQFNKSYRFDVDEYRRRFITFQTSLEVIKSMNTLRTHEDSARFGLTEYSDMTHAEFVAAKLNRNSIKARTDRRSNSIIKETRDDWKSPMSQNIIRYARAASDVDDLPRKVDWREHGVVSRVRNQGLCGACWAHSVIETVESMAAIESNSSVIELSVQQMVDCAENNNNGCQGGDTCNVLEWLVQKNISIQTMKEYPTNNNSGHCKMGEFTNGSQSVHVTKFTCERYVGQEQKVLFHLANDGPVVAAVNGLLWQNYLGGIIQFHCDGSTTSLNHAVQIVGYDLEADIPYYIVRNSWGKRFGNDGYLKVQIGGNVCGIANQVSTLGVDNGLRV
ncbi:cathepsin O-like [Bradysia coprophila]|uniref:cathepsin O-like n=1 Tax=Bradysia coprophila TaxID=38358 RepID=UPI00187D852B|nr:cathepsin O-like [Bradysia coprophila]